MTDYSKANFLSSASALKLWGEGSGSGTIPATAMPSSPPQYDRITIPHGYGSDELIFRVMIVIPGASSPFNDYFTLPTSGGGSLGTASIDDTNLYIEVGNAGSGDPAFNFNYYYWILIP